MLVIIILPLVILVCSKIDMILVREYTYSSTEYYHNSCYMNVDVNDTEYKEEYVRLDECLPNDLSVTKEKTNYVRYTYIKPDGEASSSYISKVNCNEKEHCLNPTFWDIQCKMEVLNFGCEAGTFIEPDDTFYIPSDISPGILLSFYSDPECKQFLKYVYEYVRNETMLQNLVRTEDCMKVTDDYYVVYTSLQEDWIGRDQLVLTGFYFGIIVMLILATFFMFCYQRTCVSRPVGLISLQDDYEEEVESSPRRSKVESDSDYVYGGALGMVGENSPFSSGAEQTEEEDEDEEDEEGEDGKKDQPKKEDCPCGGLNLLYYPTFLDHYFFQYYCYPCCWICSCKKGYQNWDFGRLRTLPPCFFMSFMTFSSVLSFVMMIPITILLYDLIGTISFEPGVMTILLFVECSLILPTFGVRYNLYCLLSGNGDDDDDDEYEDDDSSDTDEEEEFINNNLDEVEEKRIYLYEDNCTHEQELEGQELTTRTEKDSINLNDEGMTRRGIYFYQKLEVRNAEKNIPEIKTRSQVAKEVLTRIMKMMLRCECCYFDRWLIGCGKLFPIIVFPIYFIFWLVSGGYLFVKTIALYSSKMYVFQSAILSLFTVAFASKCIGLVIWTSLLGIMWMTAVIHLFIKLIGGFEDHNNNHTSKKEKELARKRGEELD